MGCGLSVSGGVPAAPGKQSFSVTFDNFSVVTLPPQTKNH